MTLSNFDWTDKISVKWFIMLPTGHEGPYSLQALEGRSEQGKLSFEANIWAEGLSSPIKLQEVLKKSLVDISVIPKFSEIPPIPDEEVPPLPYDTQKKESVVVENTQGPEKQNKSPMYLGVGVISLGLLIFSLFQWVKSHEKFKIHRHEKMSLELQQRIERETSFTEWGKQIFFKEYVPKDLSHIWLVTGSFHTCDVEATFQSLKDRLITLKDETVSFKTSGKLKNHVVAFSKFNFLKGVKIIPGMYELDVKATNCSWDGILPWFANIFVSPDSEYVARTKVILFDQGAESFNKLIDELIRKKIAIETKNQDQEEVFWSGLQQKFLTLNAIVLQIEQHLLEFLGQETGKFEVNFRPVVADYTTKYGSFLTNFVASNEEELSKLDKSSVKNISQKRNQIVMVRLTAKKVGLETMRIIEELQALKKPNKEKITSYTKKIKNTFSSLKDEINQKIIQVSEDRSK